MLWIRNLKCWLRISHLQALCMIPNIESPAGFRPKIYFYIFLISVWNLLELFTHSWKAVMLQSYRCATNGNVNVVNIISQMIFFKNNLIWLTSNTPKLYNTIIQVGSKIKANGYRRYWNQYLAQIIQHPFNMETKSRVIMYDNT